HGVPRDGHSFPTRRSSDLDLEEIKTAGERAAAFTRQLLAFSRRQMLQPEVVDVNALVRQMEKLLRRLLSADVELVTSLAAALPRSEEHTSELQSLRHLVCR